MNTSQSAPRERYALLAVALVSILIGGGVIYVGAHDFPIRAIGIAFVMAGTYLVQVSNAQYRSKPAVANGEMNNRNSVNVLRRVLWITSLSLVPILAGAWYLLQLDAENGGKEGWPVFLLAGVVLVCAVVWGLLVAMILGGRARGKQAWFP